MSEGRIERLSDLGWAADSWGEVERIDPCDHVSDRPCEACTRTPFGFKREAKHRTVGGRGVVGRLRGRNAG